MKNNNSYIYEFEKLRHLNPEFTYDETVDHDEWCKKAYERLSELLSLPLPKSDINYEIIAEKEAAFYRSFRMTVETEPGYFVSCCLLVPKMHPIPAPLTVCFCDHLINMDMALGEAKDEEEEKLLRKWMNYAIGLRAVKEGRCGIVIESRHCGKAGSDLGTSSCEGAAKLALLSGRTVMGERIHDAMCVIDALEKHFFEFTDTKDIVSTGTGAGGLAAYYLGCIDKRITAVLSSSAICELEDSLLLGEQCICTLIPRMRKYFEMGDLAGLIAPRKLVIASGIDDKACPIDGVNKSYKNIRMIYEKLGAADNCALSFGDAAQFNLANQLWNAYNKMK